MTCLAGLPSAPVSGCSPVEVEGISYGEASCSVVRGACQRHVWHRADRLFTQGPFLCRPLAAPPWLMPFEISSFAIGQGYQNHGVEV